MSSNEQAAARFHVRCCLRKGRSKSQTYRQLACKYGHRDALVGLIDAVFAEAASRLKGVRRC